MEVTPSETPLGVADPAAPPQGELVVQNGRLSGARRPLNVGLTMIGRAEGCDVRLNVEGVSPLHCVLVHTPAGLLVRDLTSESGTLLNGDPVGLSVLRDADLLAVGPFRFRLRLPSTGAPPLIADLQAEQDALRIQAAAVAAQQAGLTEEEGRLDQGRVALQRQEEQLATHLEEKPGQLLELRNQVRAARVALRGER